MKTFLDYIGINASVILIDEVVHTDEKENSEVNEKQSKKVMISFFSENFPNISQMINFFTQKMSAENFSTPAFDVFFWDFSFTEHSQMVDIFQIVFVLLF